MRWGVLSVAAVVAVLIAILVLAPPGRLLSRPSVAECERFASGSGPHRTKVGWVWAAEGWGWGCRYDYDDGSTGTTTFSLAS